MVAKIVKVLRTRRYAAIAALSTAAFVSIYVYAHVFGNLANVDVWLYNLPPLNLLFFAAFSVLFGITMSFQIYHWASPKVCKVDKKSVGSSSVATVLGFFVTQCPACASLGAVFLPVSAAAFLVQYSLPLNIISTALLLFTINYLGGFRG